MKKSIFIINSRHFNSQLLNNFIERLPGYRAFNFFVADEIILYLNLDPAIIIYGQEENELTKEQMLSICNVGSSAKFLSVGKYTIREEKLGDDGELHVVGIYPYVDIYNEMVDLCGDTKLRTYS